MRSASSRRATGARTPASPCRARYRNVSGDRRGRRLAPRARPDQRQFANRIAVDRHGINDAHYWAIAEIWRPWSDARAARSPRGAFGDPEQLDAIAQFVGGGQIRQADRLDALDMDRLGVDPRAERQRGEDGELMAVSKPPMSKVGSASA